ncbi:hypothetical protein [Aeromicrobium sp. Root495]|uniref:hypothetical protein n=1 Tax=Aeromicrobium sp. Root495 TaxID=1736550 RepID=UPI0012E6FE24|nr:hypothetical protein [Aeromicrobium sp. Root495]
MHNFDECSVVHVPAGLLGGPLDGQRFKIPAVPPDQTVPHALTIPLKQPAATSPFARYVREGDEPVGGYYMFFFEGCFGPAGEKVLYAPTNASLADAGAENPV